MSFILDALRKSEHERQRQAGPGLAELRPVPTRPGFPVWVIALGTLLAVNLVVLALLMLRDDANAPAPVPAGASLPTPAPAAPTPAPDSAPSSSAAALAGAAAPPRASGLPATDPYRPDEPEDAESYEEFAAEPEQAEPELQPPPRAASSDEESIARLPTMKDVALRGTTLPELHLDIHVYAAQPAERFVFLNNRKYREGGATPEGTVIERITRDGVVLTHHGVRFLLPRT